MTRGLQEAKDHHDHKDHKTSVTMTTTIRTTKERRRPQGLYDGCQDHIGYKYHDDKDHNYNEDHYH